MNRVPTLRGGAARGWRLAVGGWERQGGRLGRHAVPTLPKKSGCDVIASLPRYRGQHVGLSLPFLFAAAALFLGVGVVGFVLLIREERTGVLLPGEE